MPTFPYHVLVTLIPFHLIYCFQKPLIFHLELGCHQLQSWKCLNGFQNVNQNSTPSTWVFSPKFLSRFQWPSCHMLHPNCILRIFSRCWSHELVIPWYQTQKWSQSWYWIRQFPIKNSRNLAIIHFNPSQ